MFTPDQRNRLAKSRLMQRDQRLAVLVLFGGHTVKHLGTCRVIFAQALRKAAENPGVILFVGDRQRQHFLLAQVAELSLVGVKTHGSLF